MKGRTKRSAVRAAEPDLPGESARTVGRSNTHKRYVVAERKALRAEFA